MNNRQNWLIFILFGQPCFVQIYFISVELPLPFCLVLSPLYFLPDCYRDKT